MKRLEKNNEAKRTIESMMSVLKSDKILNLYAMQAVKGGEGNSSEIIIIPPMSTNG